MACALALAKSKDERLKVRLVSDKAHFEYHGALYRLVTGNDPMEVCIPLSLIFKDKVVEVVEDRVDLVDVKKKVVKGESGSVYGYDFLVLAVGGETEYYGIPGLEKWAFGFKTINEALALKEHLHETMRMCAAEKDVEEKKCGAHVVVVGGGASGTELAAELVVYGKELAKKHGADPSLVVVNLVQSPRRLLPELPEKMSQRIEARVRSLGVNVWVNRRVMKKDVESVYMPDVKMKSKTLVWTAGVIANRLYKMTRGLVVGKKGRVEVDGYLRARGNVDVYVVGDGANTGESGMAQTALAQGRLVARNIEKKVRGWRMEKLVEMKPVYAIPCGPGWAAVWINGWQVYGRMGWWLRRWLDWRVFRILLPWREAMAVWRSGGVLSEQCSVCRRGKDGDV